MTVQYKWNNSNNEHAQKTNEKHKNLWQKKQKFMFYNTSLALATIIFHNRIVIGVYTTIKPLNNHVNGLRLKKKEKKQQIISLVSFVYAWTICCFVQSGNQ